MENIYPMRIMFLLPKSYSGGGYRNIFIATDDENALRYFQNAFRDSFSKILFYRDTTRSSSDIGVHYEITKNPVHDKDIGYEVIRDVYTLARCRKLVAGLSNVCFAARAINIVSERPFEDCIIMNLGLVNPPGLSRVTLQEFNKNFVENKI